MKAGAHVSTAGGPGTCFERATAIGAEALQIFLTPPQQWRSSRIEPEQAADFRARHLAAGSPPVFVHAIYLINLAFEDSTNLQRSTSSLKSALRSCSELGVNGVIFHTGSHKGKGLDLYFDQVCASIADVLASTPDDVVLLIENTAGGGGTIGKEFSEIGRILRQVGHPRLGVCLDTCHCFAAGYDLTSAEGVAQAMTEFEREVGTTKLLAVHANDSKGVLGGGRDLHDNIGSGQIGREGFAHIMAHPAFRDVPFLLEVPGFDNKGPDKANVDALKEIRASVGGGRGAG